MNNKSGEAIENVAEENFGEMLEESLKSLNTNDRIMGVVDKIEPNAVYVNLDRKQTGYIPASELTNAGIGQSTAVGIGGDPVTGDNYVDILTRFEDDDQTDAVVLIGEIGGTAEERAGKFIAEEMSKPVVSYIAGRTAPPGKRMGHAGAIIQGNSGTVESKTKALNEAGVEVAKKPSEIVDLLKKVM